MASETTKYQINFKTHKDGTLVNIYADSIRELETQITDISMISALIKSTEAELYTGPRNVASAPSTPTVESVAQQFNATPVAAPATPGGAQEVRDRYGNLWVYNLPEAPECARGKMILKHGTAQATGKPYKGWFDPAAGPNWSGPKVPKEQHAQTIWA
jgi:hypothetical protein